MRTIIALEADTVGIARATSRGWHGLRAWWARQDAKRRRHATARILSALDDRTLHDIGIDRSEIGSIARMGDATRRQRYAAICRGAWID